MGINNDGMIVADHDTFKKLSSNRVHVRRIASVTVMETGLEQRKVSLLGVGIW